MHKAITTTMIAAVLNVTSLTGAANAAPCKMWIEVTNSTNVIIRAMRLKGAVNTPNENSKEQFTNFTIPPSGTSTTRRSHNLSNGPITRSALFRGPGDTQNVRLVYRNTRTKRTSSTPAQSVTCQNGEFIRFDVDSP